MSVYRVLWTASDQQNGGYYDDVDKPTEAEAVWTVATARTAAGSHDGSLPVLVDVRQQAAAPPPSD
jgi:hypothetical protein